MLFLYEIDHLYMLIQQNEISKDVFVRHMRSIVGDQVLKMAVYKLQGQVKRRDFDVIMMNLNGSFDKKIEK